MLTEREVLLEEQERYSEMHDGVDGEAHSEDEAEFVFDGETAPRKDLKDIEASEEVPFAKGTKRPRENDTLVAHALS